MARRRWDEPKPGQRLWTGEQTPLAESEVTRIVRDTSIAARKITGEIALANGGTGATTASDARTNLGLGTFAVENADGSTSQIVLGDGSKADAVEVQAILQAIHRVQIRTGAASSLVLTNQANAEQFLANSDRNISKTDLSNYSQCRLVARVVTASASVNTPRLRLRYAVSFTTVVGGYSQIGTSAVDTSIAATGLIDTGWVDLAASAKADIFLTVTQLGGDGVEDPALGTIAAEFR